MKCDLSTRSAVVHYLPNADQAPFPRRPAGIRLPRCIVLLRVERFARQERARRHEFEEKRDLCFRVIDTIAEMHGYDDERRASLKRDVEAGLVEGTA